MVKLLNLLVVIFTVILFSGNATTAEILLKDGSRLTGEIKAFHNRVYTIQTKSLGSIQIPTDKIKVINYSKSQTRVTPNSVSPNSITPNNSGVDINKFKQIQQSIFTNPSILEQVQSLQNNPQIQAILKDPEIMSAISNGDYQSLMNNKKLKKLMQNSKIQAMIEQVK